MLLDFAEASRYMTLLSPGARYDTYNYLGVAEYRRLFAAQGLSFEVDARDPRGDDGRGRARAVPPAARGARTGLATVPEDLRALVRERVEAYLARVEAAPRAGAEEQRAFLLDYGPAFWMALARRA